MFSEWSIGQFRFQISLQSKKYFTINRRHTTILFFASEMGHDFAINQRYDHEDGEFHVDGKNNY